MKNRLRFLLIFPLCIISTACYRADEYNNPDPDLLKLEHADTPVTAVADGSTAVEIRAHISQDAARGRRNVVFKTTLGSFQEGKGDSLVREADENFTATAKLVSTNVGIAHISAKAYGVTAKDKVMVDFQRASPTSLTVSVDSFAISNRINNELTITANAKLDKGRRPSAGTIVVFNVHYPSNPAGPLATAGSFVNNIRQASTDANGVARIRYSPGGVNYQGNLTITATIPTLPDSVATTTVFLYRR